MPLEHRTNQGNGMWFAAAGALIAMVVLAFPGIGAIEAILTAATGSEAAAGAGVGEAIRASGGGFGAAVGYVFDGAHPLIVPEWNGGIAQFTFIGEGLLIAWLLVGGIRSARGARRLASMVPAGPADAAARVSA